MKYILNYDWMKYTKYYLQLFKLQVTVELAIVGSYKVGLKFQRI